MRKKLVPLVFWSTALGVECLAGGALYTWLFHELRTFLFLIAMVAGLLSGILSFYVVRSLAPAAIFKKDLGMAGPGCVYGYEDFLLPYFAFNAVVIGSWYFTG